MTPHQYCQNRAAASGSSFYYSFLFLPPEKRQAITAVYAFCREVDDVADQCHDITVAAQKLQWWRSEVSRIFQGQPQHPIGHALVEVLPRFPMKKELFQELITGVDSDLETRRYHGFEELKQYCYRVASVVGLMAIEIFGYRDEHTRQYAENLGLAFQLTNILRDVREDFQRDRIYIPVEDMERFGVSENDIAGFKTHERLQQLFSFQAQRAREYYRRAFELLPAQDRYAQRSGIIMAEIYHSLLDEIQNDGFHVLEKRIKLTPLRKLWLAWKTARREKKRMKQLMLEASGA